MKAAVIREFGGPEVLRIEDLPQPELRPDEVLVAVKAASINPRDWMIREGRYPFQALLPRFPLVLGSDVSGTVVERGRRVRSLDVGQTVFGMQPSSRGFGAYAEMIAIKANVLAPKPPSMTHAEAAGIPLAGLTAYQGLTACGKLVAGQRVLILGASGGVGTFATQIAHILGAEVTGVASEGNHGLVQSLGAYRCIDYRSEDPLDPSTLDNSRPYDLVFDVIGRSSQRKASAVMTSRGIYVTTIPRQREFLSWGQSILMGLVGVRKRASRVVLVRSSGPQLRQLAHWAAAERLRTVIDSEYPLNGIAEAHGRSRTFRSRGKLIVTM